MKKFAMILSALLALVLLAAGASALTLDDLKTRAMEFLPEDAVYLSMEIDDGWNELKYWSESYQAMYEIYFDPASGELGKIKGEAWNDNGSQTVVLTEDEARLELIEVCPEAVVDFIVLDQDDGLYEYKIAFHTEVFYGVLKLNPETGDILEYERDYEAARLAAQTGAVPTYNFVTTTTETASSSGETTPDEAKALVLARLENGVVTKLEEDWDDSRLVYEGEAMDDEYEYDFEIDAATGRFIEWERDRFRQMAAATVQPAEQKTSSSSGSSSSKSSSGSSGKSSSGSSDKSSSSGSSSGLIGTDKAKSIALNKAGGGKVTSIELDRDDGRQVYEGEVRDSKYEYDFEIDAKTGKILEWDRERIDDD